MNIDDVFWERACAMSERPILNPWPRILSRREVYEDQPQYPTVSVAAIHLDSEETNRASWAAAARAMKNPCDTGICGTYYLSRCLATESGVRVYLCQTASSVATTRHSRAAGTL